MISGTALDDRSGLILTLIDKDETDLSTQQSAAKANPRVPRPDGVARRTSCAQTAAQQGSPAPDNFNPAQTAWVNRQANGRFGKEHRLRRRGDFLRVRRLGIRYQTAHFIMYLAKLPDQELPRLGFAVSRRIGNAVLRNRTKRRLRESFRLSLKLMLGAGSALVVVAHDGAAQLKTGEMTTELKPALARMIKKLETSEPENHGPSAG
jgi:ribonuclease P protein component